MLHSHFEKKDFIIVPSNFKEQCQGSTSWPESLERFGENTSKSSSTKKQGN